MMKELIKNLGDCRGKEIESIKMFDCDGGLVIRFTDNSAIVMESRDSFGTPEIEVVDTLGSASDLLSWGFISDDEYDTLMEGEREARRKEEQDRELAILKRLKSKYE